MKLIQLRIPAGYAITYNKFYDVEPILSEDSDYFIKNWEFFTEDLLQITKLKIKKRKKSISSRDRFLIKETLEQWMEEEQ